MWVANIKTTDSFHVLNMNIVQFKEARSMLKADKNNNARLYFNGYTLTGGGRQISVSKSKFVSFDAQWNEDLSDGVS